jgi:AbrB family looped-hinge helix DNA binding protein
MKKFPKIIQCDKRGQVVIPKDIRSELRIEEGTGFWVYSIEGEGIFLKKVETPPLDRHSDSLNEIEEKADKIGVSKKNMKKAVQTYKKTREGNLDVI